ncbi:MAG: hypothetical protein JO131_00425, partial [Gammaproteobacteria bacterium]|nr:hypothetical protein [Gammaproteobacteria bacterium]
HYFNKSDRSLVFLNKSEYSPLWRHDFNDSEWSPFLYHHFSARTHPQEIYENSIDVSHFAFVHHFKNLSLIKNPYFKDHTMQVRYRIRRKNIFFRPKWIDAYFTVNLYGLGCAYNDIYIPAFDMHVKMLVFTTPLSQNLVNIRIAVAIKMHRKMKLLTPYIHKIIFKHIIHDFYQDIAIWENKCYYSTPLLVREDRQIIQFRKWCKQFYG